MLLILVCRERTGTELWWWAAEEEEEEGTHTDGVHEMPPLQDSH